MIEISFENLVVITRPLLLQCGEVPLRWLIVELHAELDMPATLQLVFSSHFVVFYSRDEPIVSIHLNE